MSYATISDVVVRYPAILTMIGTGSNDVTSASVNSHYIQDAESVVNAFIAKRYVVPVSSESILLGITADLAIFTMVAERLPKVPDFMQGRYDRAMKLLESIRDGDMVLTSGTINTGQDQEVWSTTQGYHPIFAPTLDELDQQEDKDRTLADKDTRLGDTGVRRGDC